MLQLDSAEHLHTSRTYTYLDKASVSYTLLVVHSPSFANQDKYVYRNKMYSLAKGIYGGQLEQILKLHTMCCPPANNMTMLMGPRQ